MTNIDKQRIMEVASILRVESRNFYDKWNRSKDSLKQDVKSYEKYSELDKIARELDIIAEGL